MTTCDSDGQAIRGPEIEFRDLHTGWSDYPGKATAGEREEALAGFSLTLPPGQVTVLLGDHRSGKSLVALHLLLEVPLHGGQIFSNGRSVWEMSEERRQWLHSLVGVLRGGTRIKESHIDVGASVRDNIAERLRHSDLVENTEADVAAWLEDYDLTQDADSLPDQLSPGARRRLAVALALAWDPALVVLDDPGEAIDLAHFARQVETFGRWQTRTRSTVLMTLHSLQVAKAMGHQVAVLRDGQVVAHGSPAEVLDGIIDDETFERRFHTGLGGIAEADPLRLANIGTGAARWDDTYDGRPWGGTYMDLSRPMRHGSGSRPRTRPQRRR
jgi:ABC-type glutathione transport system ATPase component